MLSTKLNHIINPGYPLCTVPSSQYRELAEYIRTQNYKYGCNLVPIPFLEQLNKAARFGAPFSVFESDESKRVSMSACSLCPCIHDIFYFKQKLQQKARYLTLMGYFTSMTSCVGMELMWNMLSYQSWQSAEYLYCNIFPSLVLHSCSESSCQLLWRATKSICCSGIRQKDMRKCWRPYVYRLCPYQELFYSSLLHTNGVVLDENWKCFLIADMDKFVKWSWGSWSYLTFTAMGFMDLMVVQF